MAREAGPTGSKARSVWALPARGPGVRWVVGPDDGETLGDVLRRAGADDSGVREGRVFVGRDRAGDPSRRVSIGDVVTISARPPAAPTFAILADVDGLVAVDKPAGMPTIPDHAGAAHSLLGALARELRCPPADLHATSRLDRGVSGVVVFARSHEARDRLAAARKTGRYYRRYVALACPPPSRGGAGGPWPGPGDCGTWDTPIGRAKDPRKRAVSGRDAAPATSRYQVVAGAGTFLLFALEPVTGRTHQLRVHAAHAGAPLLGDTSYGGAARITLPTGRVIAVRRVALHAARVVVPARSQEPLELCAPIPDDLGELWKTLGGDDEAWVRAVQGAALADAVATKSRTTSK